MNRRWSVLAVAGAHSDWLRRLARWSTSATVPLELVVASDTSDAASLLSTGRPISCVLVDAETLGNDIGDLTARAQQAGAAMVLVDGHQGSSHRSGLPTLTRTFDAEDLRRALATFAISVDEMNAPVPAPEQTEPGRTSEATASAGTLVTVCGGGGSGTSTTARLVAQGLARGTDDVLLADMCLRANQAVLHDTGDVMPGLPELADEHRRGTPSCETLRELTWTAAHLPYRLLLGLRRPEGWADLGEEMVDATLGSLRRCFGTVVADTDDDLEGSAITSSADVARRNALARRSVATADLVLVTLRPDTAGLHRLVTTLGALDELGQAGQRVVPVIVRSPRNPARRAELVRAIAALADPVVLAPPLHIAERHDTETAVRAGTGLDDRSARWLAEGVRNMLGRLGPRDTGGDATDFTLGSWISEDPR